jgi:hypothetical protein
MNVWTKLHRSDSRITPLQLAQEPGWQEISGGLGLVVRGYLALVAGGLIGGALLWVAVNGGPLADWLDDNPQVRDKLVTLGVFTLCLTACLSYGLVLSGQWRCLWNAPRRQRTRQLMYLCLPTVAGASALNIVGAVLDGAGNYAALRHGWQGVERIDWWSVGNLMQLSSAALGLFASLVFSQFLRNAASSFNDRTGVRSIDFNLAFMGLLIGGSIGALVCLRRVLSTAEILPWLTSGWLSCFGWHLWLVWSIRRTVEASLRREQELTVRAVPASQIGAGLVRLHSLSGLRRMANRVKRDGFMDNTGADRPDPAMG